MKNPTKPSLWPAVGSVAITLVMLAALVILLVQPGQPSRVEVAAIVMAIFAVFGWALLTGVAIATWVVDRRFRDRTGADR